MPTHRRRGRGLAAAALLAVLVLGYVSGCPLNSIHRAAAPAVDASAADVTLAYLAAYNSRDFRLAQRLYPSSSGYSRTQPMGHYDDAQVARLLAEDPDGSVRTIDAERDRTLVWVMVRYTATGFADSDRAVQDGPGGTGFQLSRADRQGPWRITSSGSP